MAVPLGQYHPTEQTRGATRPIVMQYVPGSHSIATEELGQYMPRGHALREVLLTGQ
jgi:hypothetical protein